MDKLKPCPFCGGSDIDPTFWATIKTTGPGCNDCSATADSIETWNHRPSNQTMEDREIWQRAMDMLNEIHETMGIDDVIKAKMERLAVDKIVQKHLLKLRDAIKAWNTRNNADKYVELVEAAKAMYDLMTTKDAIMDQEIFNLKKALANIGDRD